MHSVWHMFAYIAPYISIFIAMWVQRHRGIDSDVQLSATYSKRTNSIKIPKLHKTYIVQLTLWSLFISQPLKLDTIQYRNYIVFVWKHSTELRTGYNQIEMTTNKNVCHKKPANCLPTGWLLGIENARIYWGAASAGDMSTIEGQPFSTP